MVGGCAANSYMFLCSLANALGGSHGTRPGTRLRGQFSARASPLCRCGHRHSRNARFRRPADCGQSIPGSGSLTGRSPNHVRLSGVSPGIRLSCARLAASETRAVGDSCRDPERVRLRTYGSGCVVPTSRRDRLTNAEAAKGAIDCLRLRRKLL